MTWFRSLIETVSMGIDSVLSSNRGAEAKPSTISANSAQCSAADTASPQYDRRSSKAAPGY